MGYPVTFKVTTVTQLCPLLLLNYARYRYSVTMLLFPLPLALLRYRVTEYTTASRGPKFSLLPRAKMLPAPPGSDPVIYAYTLNI